MELKLYYSVRNGGDGSAYPTFMSSQELADFDQDNMSEGWGESCTGSITLLSDSPITIKEKIETPESFFINLIDNDSEEEVLNDFVKQFFPNGKPTFRVETRPIDEEYLYNDVFVEDKMVFKGLFLNKEDSGEVLEKKLNE